METVPSVGSVFPSSAGWGGTVSPSTESPLPFGAMPTAEPIWHWPGLQAPSGGLSRVARDRLTGRSSKGTLLGVLAPASCSGAHDGKGSAQIRPGLASTVRDSSLAEGKLPVLAAPRSLGWEIAHGSFSEIVPRPDYHGTLWAESPLLSFPPLAWLNPPPRLDRSETTAVR